MPTIHSFTFYEKRQQSRRSRQIRAEASHTFVRRVMVAAMVPFMVGKLCTALQTKIANCGKHTVLVHSVSTGTSVLP